jgi:hypothetical protein
MKLTSELIMVAGTGTNLIIDASTRNSVFIKFINPIVWGAASNFSTFYYIPAIVAQAFVYVVKY